MAYREDRDLHFLGRIPSNHLNELVSYLTRDKDGEVRLTEELTMHDLYKRHYPDHHQYWREIAAELQCFGANTFATIFRGGKGVVYREVLTDVCDKMKVNYNKKSDVERIEMNLLLKILEDSIDEMDSSQLGDLINLLHLNVGSVTPQAVTLAIQLLIRQGGFRSYQLALIVANAVARALLGSGLTLAANATLTRVLSIFAGPIGWLVTGIWTAADIAGPAYRVTIPATIQVAYLRQLAKTL